MNTSWNLSPKGNTGKWLIAASDGSLVCETDPSVSAIERAMIVKAPELYQALCALVPREHDSKTFLKARALLDSIRKLAE